MAVKNTQDTGAYTQGPEDLLSSILPPDDYAKRVRDSIASLKKGNYVVLIDGKKEKEADLVLAAKYANEKKIAEFMHIVGNGGSFCVALTEEQIKKLKIHDEKDSMDPDKPNFTTVVDSYSAGSGIQAIDRAMVVYDLIHGRYDNLKKGKGHTFPLRSSPKGVYDRRGHTEGAVDLTKLAKLDPLGAVIQEIFYIGENKDRWGHVLWGEGLAKFIEKYKFSYLSIDDIIKYRNLTENPGLDFKVEGQ